MKHTPKDIIVRCVVILIGVAITGLGCACYLVANLGSDPVTAFVQGLGRSLGTTAGMGTNILNATAFVILLLVNRKLIHIGTALYTLLLGLAVDLSVTLVTSTLGATPDMVVRVILLIAGTLAIACGLGLYQAAELGTGPTDGINQTIVAKTCIPYRWERMIFDAVMALGGWLLGGVIGIGTIVGILCVGPIMAPTIEWGKKRIAHMLAA